MAPMTRRLMLAGLMTAAGATVFRPSRAANPKVLVAAIDEDPVGLNPAISSTNPGFEAATVMYNGLMVMDVDGNLHPDLAERWEVSADARSFTFYLRQNVVWHDGKPFTSGDVKFTLTELLAKYQPIGKGAYKFLDRVDAPDDHTVVVRMNQPYAPFLNIPQAWWPILPRHLWEGADVAKSPYNQRPIGTGPYRLTERIAGGEFRFAKHDKYHIPGQPAFDEYVIRVIPEASARVSAFLNREVDILLPTAVPATELDRLRKIKTVTVSKPTYMPGATWMGLVNTRSPPFADVRVRRALVHALDRRFVREAVLAGISQEVVGPLWPSSPLYNRSLKDYPYDQAAAKKLLDDAGQKPASNGIRFDLRLLYIATDSRSVKIAEIMKQQFGQVGVNTILTPLERSTLNQMGYVEGKFDIILSNFALGTDPDAGMERFYNSANIRPLPNLNASGYRNPEVDKLLDEQRIQIEFARRKEIYDKIQELIWNDVPTLPIATFFSPGVFRSDYVVGPFETFNSAIDNLAFARPAR